MRRSLKEKFDVVSYLEDHDVEYSLSGDNVSAGGWIGVQCPFCYDPKNHCGINLEHKNFYCWICNEKGDIVKLIQELENTTFIRAKHRVEEYQEHPLIAPKRTNKRLFQSILPSGAFQIEEGKEPSLVLKYFKKRRFPLSWCQKYDLHFCPAHGEYPLRLIIPVFQDGEVVSFQAADMTGKASKKYEHCPNDRAKAPNTHNLYGIDDVGDQVVLVEGVVDKWRIGDAGVAMFSKRFTREQILLLHEKAKNKVIKILLDADTVDSRGISEEAEKLCSTLMSQYGFVDVAVYTLSEGDPGSLSPRLIDMLLRRHDPGKCISVGDLQG